MDSIDRLGWAAGISVSAYGVLAGIRVNDPAALDRLPDYLPYTWKISTMSTVEQLYSLILAPPQLDTRIRRFNLLYGNALRLARSHEPEDVLQALASDLQLYVAENAPRRVFIHAGVGGWENQAILIPGRSFSGKSTLVAELVRAGAVYYSDEYAVVDDRGRVHPYPRPLTLRQDGKQTRRSIADLGGLVGSKPLPVRLVLATEYRAGAHWRPRQLSPGRGVLELLAHAVPVRRRPQPVLETLQVVAEQARILKGPRGEAGQVAHCILGSLHEDQLDSLTQAV
jgi:hypothetical protein